MIVRLVILAIIISGLYIIYFRQGKLPLVNYRKRATRSPNAKKTMFDVRNLLLNGEKEMAIKVYGEIFKTSRAEAIKAVDDLEKSLH